MIGVRVTPVPLASTASARNDTGPGISGRLSLTDRSPSAVVRTAVLFADGDGLPRMSAVRQYVISSPTWPPATVAVRCRSCLNRLREMDVLIGSYEPHRPKSGGAADRFRWEEALDLLEPRFPQ